MVKKNFLDLTYRDIAIQYASSHLLTLPQLVFVLVFHLPTLTKATRSRSFPAFINLAKVNRNRFRAFLILLMQAAHFQLQLFRIHINPYNPLKQAAETSRLQRRVL